MGTTGTEIGRRLLIGDEIQNPVRAEAENNRWRRAVRLAQDVVESLTSKVLPTLPPSKDELAIRAMLRGSDSLAGLSRSLFDQGMRVQVIGTPDRLPAEFAADDLDADTYLSVNRREPLFSDVAKIRGVLGRSAAAYLVTDVPPSDPSLSRSAVLHAGVNGSDLLLRRVDDAGEYVDSYESGEGLFEKLAGQAVLTVVTGRIYAIPQISCGTSTKLLY